MSGTAGAAPPPAVLGFGLDVGGSWQQRAARRSGAPLHIYPLTGSGLPPASAASNRATKAPLRLPSLVAGPRRRSSMARLSLSEPSLFTTKENILFEGFSCSRISSALHKQQTTPPLTLSKSPALLPGKASPRPMTGSPLLQKRGCGGPTYIHFSHAIQPCSRPRPARRHSHNPALSSETAHGDRRPAAGQHRDSPSEGEPLSVVGRPCLLSCGQRSATAGAAAGATATAGPARTQLHVFLPSEADGEEADSESVDEGFMDELDSKISTLKIQRGAAKAVAHRS